MLLGHGAMLLVGLMLFTQLASGAGAGPMISLPGLWSDVLLGQRAVGLGLSAAAVLLLVTADFPWMTARQNVVDGLSKTAFTVSKLATTPLVALLFLASMGVIVGAWGIAVTDLAGDGVVLVRVQDALLWTGYGLAMLGYGWLATLAAFIVRSPGPALITWGAYTLLIEPILIQLRSRAGWTLPWLPLEAFGRLVRPATWADGLGGAGGVLLISGLYLLAIAGAAILVQARRDL
jgi:hypothetical protein